MALHASYELEAEIPVGVGKPGPTAQIAIASVEIRDDDYPDLIARFRYRGPAEPPVDVVMQVKAEPRQRWQIVGVSVEAAVTPALQLTVTRLRKLPLVQWERSARTELEGHIKRELLSAIEAVLRDKGSIATTAPGPAPARLVEIADEYRQLVSAGDKFPARTIAQRHKVAGSTARAWLRRARERGLLS